MSLVIFCGDAERSEYLPRFVSIFGESDVAIHLGGYRDVVNAVQRSILLINVLNNNFSKSERYRLRLLAERFGVSFCVVEFRKSGAKSAEDPSPDNKHDRPYFNGYSIPIKELREAVDAPPVRRSIAHRKRFVDSNYMTELKRAVQAIKSAYGDLPAFDEIEMRMMSSIHADPKDLKAAAECYEGLVKMYLDGRYK